MSSWIRNSSVVLAVVVGFTSLLLAGSQSSEQVQVGPPPLHRAAPPVDTATEQDLEKRGDELRYEKNFLDAREYYIAAIRKSSKDTNLLNKLGICELMMQRFKDARKTLERSIKADKKHADAYNNLGVVYYQMALFHHDSSNYGKAIKMYDKAIALSDDSASYYNNRAAALFAKRKYEEASVDYAKALALDPDIFERTSHAGVQAMLPSPEDRARYEYVLAKLYAKVGAPDRSLHYLRKAMEDGYKDIKNVYKDNEFSELRKDPRFGELMAAKLVAIPE